MLKQIVSAVETVCFTCETDCFSCETMLKQVVSGQEKESICAITHECIADVRQTSSIQPINKWI